ncbi:MAG: glycogen synthase GlgA [Acidobacteria bacterium]|nr:glycogen synthase GlgA [Acidobacteriota bacterium]
MRILFVSPECVPFAKTGGLADVVGALPKVLVRRGHEVAVVLPRYRAMQPGKPLLPSLTVILGRQAHFPSIQEGPPLDGVHHFFVDYPPFFDREELYTVRGEDYPDNGERFALFTQAALEAARRLFIPDVVHCHEWQSALLPVLLRTQQAADPLLGRVPVVLTIHNLGYQGLFPPEVLDRIGLPWSLFHMEALEFYGKVNFLKGGIVFADSLTTVSRKYAQEIQTPEYGHGLDGILRTRSQRVTGILNGVDYSEWNPETDKFLVANYSASKLGGKLDCKRDLLAQFQLPTNDLEKPVIGIVSRFAAQKGFDLIGEVAASLLRNDLYLVALGTGEPLYEELFRKLARRYPKKVGVRIAYDNALAHKIEGGADMFLMPSRYEPCGLNQIYSLKYGTVPVVRATGGLDDTIEPYDPRTDRGTGFKFSEYAGRALLDCLRQALRLYTTNHRAWQKLILNGMQQDFSWNTSAVGYEKLYQSVAAERKAAS